MTGRSRSLKFFRWGLWATVALAAVALIMLSDRTPAPQIASLPGAVKIGGPFKLTSHTGDAFDSRNLAGKPYMVFFGFTHCPDICPTTLLDITNQIKDLGDRAKDLKTLFITVDPERDTPEHLSNYLASFDKSIIGLTGSAADIKEVATSFRAMYEKVPAEDSANAVDYSMNHTATVYLMDRTGRFSGTLSFEEKANVRAKKLERLLGS